MQLEEDYGKEVALKIVAMFLPDAEARIEQVEQAAHGLKSGAANVGAAEMARYCEQLERQGELGSLVDAEESFAKLVESWTSARKMIAAYH